MPQANGRPTASCWRVVHRSASVVVGDYRCRVHHVGRGAEEYSRTSDFALPRMGVFVKHVGGRDVVAEPNTIAFFNAGEPYRVSHPGGLADRCTTFAPSPEALAAALAARDPAAVDRPHRPFAHTHGPCDRGLFLAHRSLLARAASGDADAVELDERALDVLDRAAATSIGPHRQSPPSRQRVDTRRAHADLVQAAKIAMASRFDQRLSLDEIAAEACSSPYHLSRVFRSHTGCSLHEHLRRLRLRNALEALLDDGAPLTAIALRSGFFDHSHFANAFRAEFGFAPSQARTALARRTLRQMSRDFQAS